MLLFAVLLLLIFILAILLWYHTPDLVNFLFDPSSPSWEHLAKVGDAFGSINALFAALAFAGVAVAVFLQKRELDQTRTQVAQQNFDSTFFKMLELHHSLVSDVTYKDKSGRAAFTELYKAYAGTRQGQYGTNDIDRAQANNTYEIFYNSNSAYIAHYFRNLYRIVKFIDDSTLSNKQVYAGLVRAQLSRDELRMLFYNGLSSHGTKFEPLLKKYAFFEHLRYQDLYKPTDWQFYGRDAFGDQQIP